MPKNWNLCRSFHCLNYFPTRGTITSIVFPRPPSIKSTAALSVESTIAQQILVVQHSLMHFEFVGQLLLRSLGHQTLLRITALPDLMHNAEASLATFGLLSKIMPITPSGVDTLSI